MFECENQTYIIEIGQYGQNRKYRWNSPYVYVSMKNRINLMNWNMLNLLYKMKLVTSANLTTWMKQVNEVIALMIFMMCLMLNHVYETHGWTWTTWLSFITWMIMVGCYGWNLDIWMEPNNVKQIDKQMYEINNIKTFKYGDGVNTTWMN